MISRALRCHRLVVSVLALASVAGAAGCGGGGRSLVVELRTDYVAGVEALQVEVELIGSVSGDVQSTPFSAGDDLLGGLHVAGFAEPAAGDQTIELRLISAGSRVLAKRRVIVAVAASGVTGVTVIITRDCARVVCPGAGDASATECLNGTCVPPGCSAARPDLCAAAVCEADADCGADASACASRRCREGVCLDVPDEGACGAGEVCLPGGCVARPADAGADASRPDADRADAHASDRDAATPDAGPADPLADLEACRGYVGVPQFGHAPNRDIEFLAFGDTHFGAARDECARKGTYRDDQNSAMITALNAIETATWPTGFSFRREGRVFRNIRGVILAGDITENGDEQYPEFGRGSCGDWATFRSMVGLCGDRDLDVPIYEGFGNHDFPFSEDRESDHHPVLSYISRRNPYRVNVTNFAPPEEERAHYSWDWDDIHFVQLNVKPSGTSAVDARYEYIGADAGLARLRRIDPREALRFLDEDLAAHLGGTRQVVLVSHYGPSNGSRLPSAERAALCAVLGRHDARVIAWLHGHTHKSDVYEWSCGGRMVPVINVGSPLYEEGMNGNRLHFAAVRIGTNWLEAVDVSFQSGAPTEYEIPGWETANPWADRSVPPDGVGDRDPFNPDQLWGGWTLRVPIDRPLP